MNRCPTHEQLNQLLDEVLDDGERLAIEEHVDRCSRCQGTLEELTRQANVPRPGRAPGEAVNSTDGTDFLLRLTRQPSPARPSSQADTASRVGDLATDSASGTNATPPETSARPDIPGYDVLEVLGRGGMGVVHKARHRRLNRLVALKLLVEPGDDPDHRARFRAEAEAVASLQHPHIVQIYDIGESGGRPYLALEYVPGGSLRERINGTPQLATEAAQLIETLAQAVHVAHQRGILHRDLKPANILLTSEGVPKIADFGLAKSLEVGSAETAGGPVTRSGVLVGSPGYMAPEQAASSTVKDKPRKVGPAADVYALGATLYELLTGRPPFRCETALETVLQTLTHDPVPPRRLVPKVPRDLETICLKCLEKDPSRRYDSALALAEDLRRFADGRAIRARPVGILGRGWRWCRRNRLVAGLSVVILLVVGSGAAAAWVQHRRQVDQNATRDREVNAVVDSAFRLQAQRDGAAALAEARRAEGLLSGAALPKPTHARVKDLVSQLEAAERDRRLIAQLERLNAELLTAKKDDLVRIRQHYTQILQDYGLDIPALWAGDFASLSPELRVRVELATALDWWAHSLQWEKAEAGPLLEAARRLDPDSFRNEVREAQTNVAVLRQLADRVERSLLGPPEASLPMPTSLALLGSALRLLDPPRARSFLRLAVRRYPDDFTLNSLLGGCLDESQQGEEAVPFHTAAVALRPDLIPPRLRLGMILTTKGALAEAEAILREVIRLDPENVLGHKQLGMILYRKQAYEAAIAAFREAIRLHPTDGDAHLRLGFILAAQGQAEEAQAAFEKALCLRPEEAKLHLELGYFLLNEKAPDRATAAFGEAVRLKPAEAQAHYGLGLALREGGDRERATAAFREAIRLQPRVAEYHYGLGQTLLDGREFEEAAQAFSEVVRLQPTRALAHMRLAGIALQQGRVDEAVARYQEALRHQPILRFDAVGSAVVQGCGSTRLSEVQRTQLRQQALSWLREELAYLGLPEDQRPVALRVPVGQYLRRWQQAPQLSGVRDEAARSKLPAGEHQAWRQLWTAVEVLQREPAR